MKHSSNIITKLNYCVEDISTWSRDVFPNYRQLINKQRSKIDEARNSMLDGSDPSIEGMQKNLASLLLQEETYWRQRSKIFWLSDGDTNSKFFHASASARKKKNTIKKLKDAHGNWVMAHDDLCTLVRDYFTTIFAARHGDHNPIISCVHSRVTSEDNLLLTQPFSEIEFKEAIFSMHPDKSPGPDGLNPAFYHRFWDEIGGDIFSSASSWLATGTLPPDLRATNIVLAPKGDNPESMKDLRPISLCNVLYKIISKVLANRLKPLISKWISPEQAAFVHSRSIMDKVQVQNTSSKEFHFIRYKSIVLAFSGLHKNTFQLGK